MLSGSRVSYMEVSALRPWLVRPASDLDCTVTVCGSHVKRVLMLAFSLIFLDD